MAQNVQLDYGDPALEPFFDATQEMLSGAAINFRLVRASATTVRVPAGAGHDQAALSIQGRYRYIAANADRVVVGAAGAYDVFATASDNDFTGAPPNVDLTVYAFALAVVPAGNNPGGVALFRKVGTLAWDGAQITSLVGSVGSFPGSAIEAGAIAPGPSVSVARQADGSLLLDVIDGTIGAAEVTDFSIGANEIAKSLQPSWGAGAGTEALRSLGIGASTAAAGNDARLSDQRVPVDGSVTAPKVNAALKPSGGALAGDEALRALGTSAATAAAGNDARLSNARTPTAHGNSHQLGLTDALVPGSFGELAAHDEFVAGVVHDSDFMPTINAGGTRVFNGNLGKAAIYIAEPASGFLIRHALPGGSVIIGHPANASGNPRVDQVVASYAGPGGQTPNFQVLQGNPTAGAQIINPNAANYRAGALALPAGYVRIADCLIAAGAPANTVATLVDRRPFCRGARVVQMKTNGAVAVNPGVAQVAIDAATLQARIECTGRPVKITLQTNVALDTADFIATGLFMDGLPYLGGAAPQDIVSVNAPGPGARNPSYTVCFTPAAGSHLFTPTHRCTNAGATGYSLSGSATKPTMFIVEEDLRDSQANGTV